NWCFLLSLPKKTSWEEELIALVVNVTRRNSDFYMPYIGVSTCFHADWSAGEKNIIGIRL
ncbi:MAG: hypothetical protein KAS26_08655, partial [Sulfurimonas sp.]|nr:hypothetical protein [Sulfurimonas sp.]